MVGSIKWEKQGAVVFMGGDDNAKRDRGMGFRDLKLFNQALLARQAWRLIYYADSLCARLLKAKYYRQGKLTETAFPSNASPTWKAIEYRLELLKKGTI